MLRTVIRRCFLALGLSLGVAGCGPSLRQNVSAERVGCAASEIQVSEVEEGSSVGGGPWWVDANRASNFHAPVRKFYASETWQAECRGRTFICARATLAMTPNPQLNGALLGTLNSLAEEKPVETLSCHLVKDADAPPSKVPTGAAGFDFGTSAQAAQSRCEGAGKSWRVGTKGGVCSGPAVDLGFPAQVGIYFCHGRACVITIQHRPKAAWIPTIIGLRDQLAREYLTPVQMPPVPSECRSEAQLVGCFERGEFRLPFSWNWASGERVILLAGKPEQGEGDAAIWIQYTKPIG
jgi:hypothetical protein